MTRHVEQRVEKEIKKFIEIWMFAVKNGYDLNFVADETKYKHKHKVADRASYLRKLGYKLPRLNIGVQARKMLKREVNQKIDNLIQSL